MKIIVTLIVIGTCARALDAGRGKIKRCVVFFVGVFNAADRFVGGCRLLMSLFYRVSLTISTPYTVSLPSCLTVFLFCISHSPPLLCDVLGFFIDSSSIVITMSKQH